MSAKNQFETLLLEFGQMIGIEPLTLNEESGCTLSFDGQVINIQFIEEDGSFILFSELGRVLEAKRAQIYQEMLAANFYRNQMVNAALTYCAPTDSTVLVLKHTVAGLEFRQFQELIQKFIDIAESWTLRIMDECESPSDGKEGSSDDTSQEGWVQI